MDDLNHFDLMRRYATGQMSAAQRAEFERRLTHDPTLASEWADYQLIAAAVGQHKPDAAAVRAAMQSAQDELRAEGFFDEVYADIWQDAQVNTTASAVEAPPPAPQQARRVLFSSYTWLAAAASLAIVLMAWWFWPRSSSLPPFDLQAELQAGHRQLGFTDQDTVFMLRQWLSEGRSSEVIAFCESRTTGSNPAAVITAEEESLERRLCYGLALLQKEQYRTALVVLEAVMNAPEATFETEYEARYFAAQAYLALGDVPRGTAALHRVADDTAKGNGQKSTYAAAAANRLAALKESGCRIEKPKGGEGKPHPQAPQRRDVALEGESRAGR